MSQSICSVCERSYNIKNMRSHSNRATKKKQKANLQWTRIGKKRVRVCTKCIKALRNKEAFAQSTAAKLK